MISESARMSSAAEARFRVQAANARPRATLVIALDVSSEYVVRRLAEAHWTNATFLTASTDNDDHAAGSAADGWLTDLAGTRRNVQDEVDAADVVIMVATADGHAEAAAMIGRACSLKRVTTTALIVGSASASDEALSRTLAQLRPWSLMVVIGDDDDYIREMMMALRA
ncbi:MAG TPA: hypothetical protein VG222_15855 [Vicinamibacterales bacterium]|nr:hypothetical protein [Vicinamibacterales bacterium]